MTYINILEYILKIGCLKNPGQTIFYYFLKNNFYTLVNSKRYFGLTYVVSCKKNNKFNCQYKYIYKF